MRTVNLGILSPVYNDWVSANVLYKEIHKILDLTKIRPFYFFIDDASMNYEGMEDLRKHKNKNIEIIYLNTNLGHQRALAAGLSYLSKEKNLDAVVILDSDGEDNPEYINDFISEFLKDRNRIVVAERTKRSESLKFRAFYQVYKFLFKLLTGKSISFGNFSLLSKFILDRIVHQSDLWNHIPSALIRSNFPIVKVKTIRSKRYFGESKMNFFSLVLLGISAFAF